jgi:predicted KAP-like P-loop ATPase
MGSLRSGQMPEIDSRYRLVFERAYAARLEAGSWPTIESLQRQLASEHHDVSVRAVVNEARGYASLGSPGEEVQLTLRALAHVPAARPVLEGYLQAVRTMVSRYRDPTVEAKYERGDLERLHLAPAIQAELGRLLPEDAWPFGSGQIPEDGQWSFAISDRVLMAADAESVEEFVAIRFGEPVTHDTAPGVPPEPLAPALGSAPAVDPDQPISRPEDDLLARAALAHALAVQAVSQPQGHGFVMGVSGAWGSGKTSLLNLMAAAIDEASTGYVVRFDPWMFSSSEELVLRFLREISAQLGHDRRLVDVATRISDYAQVLAPFAVLTPVPWVAPAVTAWGRATGSWRKKRTAVSAEQQRQKVQEALHDLDRRLVVLIDDLDRLEAAEVRDIVRLVKLVGDFPNTTYVLAYDQPRVARALGASEQEGHEFLEKIVQLSHDVPPTTPEVLGPVLAKAISTAVGDLSRYRFDQQAYTNIFAAGVRDLFATVRDVRRYTNVLPATLALVRDEIELADVLALEALRVRAPRSFALITLYKQALTATQAAGFARDPQLDAVAGQQIEEIVQAAGRFHDEVRAVMRRLFPAIERHLGGSSYGPEWLGEWRRECRVAHPEVLDIYLNRALPASVLAASLVERAFHSLGDRDALTSILDDLDSDELESVLDRLEQFEQQFPTEHTEIPVSVLYNQRGRLRTDRRHAFDIGAEHKVARVVLRILRRLHQEEVARATQSALGQIRTLSDRGDLVRLVGYREGSGHQLVSEQDADQLETSVIEEVLAADASALSEERDLLRTLFWARDVREKEARDHVEQLITDDQFLVVLLRSALGETVGQTSGEAAVHRTYELNWHALTQLVDQDDLIARIRHLRGTEPHFVDDRTRLALDPIPFS